MSLSVLWKLVLAAVVVIGAAFLDLVWFSRGCRFTPEREAQTEVRVLRTAVQAARADIGIATCLSVQQLVAAGFVDPGSRAEDRWGTPFDIVCTDEDVVVSSAGPDRRWGTTDDIRVPRQE